MLKEQLQSKYITETFWSIAAKGVAFVCFYGTNIFLARFLGVDDFGFWSFFFSFLSIILLLSLLGISPAAKYLTAKYQGTEFLHSVWVSSLKLRLRASAVFCAVYLILAYPLALLLDKPGLFQLIVLSLPLVFFSGMVEYFKNVSAGLHALKTNFVITSVEYGSKLILTISFLLLVNSVLSIIGAYTLSLMIAAVVAFFLINKNFIDSRGSVSKDFTADLTEYAKMIFLISIAVVVSTEVDTLMLGLLHNTSEVGVYAGAKQLVIYLPQISIAISLGTMPPFARLNEDNKRHLRLLFRNLLLLNALIFGLLGICLFILADWFVPFALGEEYQRGSIVLKLLIPFLIAASFVPFVDGFLDYQGKVRRRTVNYLIALVLNIVLNLILIPKYGALGAASATSLSFVPCLILNSLHAKKVWSAYFP
jgi:O-antigen/teichoic acid export membrane protein